MTTLTTGVPATGMPATGVPATGVPATGMPAIRLLALIAALLLAIGGSSMATAIEEPKYELLATLEDIEIRRYDDTIQAITTMPKGRGNGFRRLAGYIFGGNSDQAEISMTAPVATTLSGDEAQMAFTMPSEWTMETLPEPEDSSVRLREVPAFTAAVIVFSGRATEKRSAEMAAQLQARLAAEGIEPQGQTVLNQYDPPWKLPFMRRNEIMVRINWP